MTLSKRGELPEVVPVRSWLQQVVKEEQQRQRKAECAPSASQEEEGDAEDEDMRRHVQQEPSRAGLPGRQEHATSSEGQHSHNSGSALAEQQQRQGSARAAVAASGRLQEERATQEDEGESGGEEAGEDGDMPGADRLEGAQRLCLHCQGTRHHGRSW